MSGRIVELTGGTPWGFRIHGGYDVKQPIKVSRVNPGSRAEKSGLREGSIITSINGISTKFATKTEAQELLNNSYHLLKLGLNEDIKSMVPGCSNKISPPAFTLKRPSQHIAELQCHAPIYATIRPKSSPSRIKAASSGYHDDANVDAHKETCLSTLNTNNPFYSPVYNESRYRTLPLMRSPSSKKDNFQNGYKQNNETNNKNRATNSFSYANSNGDKDFKLASTDKKGTTISTNEQYPEKNIVFKIEEKESVSTLKKIINHNSSEFDDETNKIKKEIKESDNGEKKTIETKDSLLESEVKQEYSRTGENNIFANAIDDKKSTWKRKEDSIGKYIKILEDETEKLSYIISPGSHTNDESTRKQNGEHCNNNCK